MANLAPRHQGRGHQFKRVRIDEIIWDRRLALCEDTEGHRVQVPMHVQPTKGGHPQVDEVWLITREFGSWSFAAIMNREPPPVITASSEGADPLAVQLLDAMLQAGLVQLPEVDTAED